MIRPSLGEVFAERFNNPFVTSFAISWSLWNYKFFVILFSDASIKTTFRLINEIRFPDWQAWGLHGIFMPLVFSLAYIFVLPIPSEFIYRYWKKAQKRMNDIKQEIGGETLLTLQESRAYREDRRQLEIKIDEARDATKKVKDDLAEADTTNGRLSAGIAAAQTELATLRTQLLDAQTELAEVKKKNPTARGTNPVNLVFSERTSNEEDAWPPAVDDSENLSRFQLHVLVRLVTEPGLTKNDFFSQKDPNHLSKNYEFEDLEGRRFIEISSQSLSRTEFKLGHEGIGFLLRNRLIGPERKS